MDWVDATEIVGGLVLKKRLSLNAVRPDIFMPPYSAIIKDLKTGLIVEDIIERHGHMLIQTCFDAVQHINGVGDKNWVRILENSASNYQAGVQLEKLANKLQRGDPVDWSKITSISSKAQAGLSGNFTPLSEVEAGQVPFIKTGWKVLDDHLTGVPATGLILVGGDPGSAKTSFMVKLASKFAKKYPNKNIAVHTLEMVQKEIATRFDEIEKLDKKTKNRILINDIPVTPEECINKSATIDNLGLVCIDFADLMIRGETTESTMAHIYRTLMLGAKQLGIPIVLISQLNRRQGGIPRPHHLRYTGLAESLAWMILMLYNPSTDWHAKEEAESTGLKTQGGKAYIIVWKIRGGFRVHLDESPGAIYTPFRGDKGWHNTYSRWFSLRGR